MNQTLELKLLGQKTVLKSQGDPELVQEVLQLVSSKLEYFEQKSKSTAPHHIALLALLDLAEEYVQAKKRYRDHAALIERKSDELIESLKSPNETNDETTDGTRSP